jgi:hypothetical protein
MYDDKDIPKLLERGRGIYQKYQHLRRTALPHVSAQYIENLKPQEFELFTQVKDIISRGKG